LGRERKIKKEEGRRKKEEGGLYMGIQNLNSKHAPCKGRCVLNPQFTDK
jgi:hypothetical protein